jgi:hypothetical protein
MAWGVFLASPILDKMGRTDAFCTPFRNGVCREGVCDDWEEDGEVELVGGFCIHVMMKQKLGFCHCDGLYVLEKIRIKETLQLTFILQDQHYREGSLLSSHDGESDVA